MLALRGLYSAQHGRMTFQIALRIYSADLGGPLSPHGGTLRGGARAGRRGGNPFDFMAGSAMRHIGESLWRRIALVALYLEVGFIHPRDCRSNARVLSTIDQLERRER